MSDEKSLLGDLLDGLTSNLHKRLIAAYLEQPRYESLLAACTSEIEARIDEIDKADNTGVPWLQPEGRS